MPSIESQMESLRGRVASSSAFSEMSSLVQSSLTKGGVGASKSGPTSSTNSHDLLGAALARAAQNAAKRAGGRAASTAAIMLFVETEWDVLNRAGPDACSKTLASFGDAVTAARAAPGVLAELRLLARPLIDLGIASGFEVGAKKLEAAAKLLPLHPLERFYDGIEDDDEEEEEEEKTSSVKGKAGKKQKKTVTAAAETAATLAPASDEDGPELDEAMAAMLLESLLEEAESSGDTEGAAELRMLLKGMGVDMGEEEEEKKAAPKKAVAVKTSAAPPKKSLPVVQAHQAKRGPKSKVIAQTGGKSAARKLS